MTKLSSNEKGEKIMQDFNEFSSSTVGNETPPYLLNLVKNLSKKFDVKSQNDLLKAIYSEAVKVPSCLILHKFVKHRLISV